MCSKHEAHGVLGMAWNSFGVKGKGAVSSTCCIGITYRQPRPHQDFTRLLPVYPASSGETTLSLRWPDPPIAL